MEDKDIEKLQEEREDLADEYLDLCSCEELLTSEGMSRLREVINLIEEIDKKTALLQKQDLATK